MSVPPRLHPVAVLLVVLAAAAAVPAARAGTLREAVIDALAISPTVRTATAQARVTGYERQGAGTTMNPRLGAYTQPGFGYVRGFGRSSGFDAGVVATQPLYDGSRTSLEVARQTARLAAANVRIELARADVATQVSDGWIEALKRERLVVLTREYVGHIAQLHGRVRDIVRLDRGRGYDLLQIDSRLRSAELALAAREGDWQDQLAALAQLVGHPVRELQPPPEPPPAPERFETIDAALDLHPSLVAARGEVEAARKAAERARAWYRPAVSLQGRVSSPEYPLGQRRWFGGYQAGLVTEWNPFDGGAGAAAARAAAAQLDQAESQLAANRLDLATALSRAWTQVRMRSARADRLDGLVQGAQKVRAAYWEQFQIGRRTMVDLLNAENETWQAALSVATERAELLQARYRLLGAEALLPQWFDLPPVAPVP